jgi:hypothetical protein
VLWINHQRFKVFHEGFIQCTPARKLRGACWSHEGNAYPSAMVS